MITLFKRKQPIITMAAIVAVITILGGLAISPTAAQEPDNNQSEGTPIKLLSRTFTPSTGLDAAIANNLTGQTTAVQHILVQLYRIPNDAERAALATAGVELLGYIPDNAWFASVSSQLDLNAPDYQLIRWAGPILPEDKISPAIQQNGVGAWAIEADGQVNLHLILFQDVTDANARALINRYLGQTQQGNMAAGYKVRFPDATVVQKLAAEDIVQWVDNVAPPARSRSALAIRETQDVSDQNDGARDRTNVNTLQAAQPGANGAGVRLGVWDGGVDPNHPDFSGRIWVDPQHDAPSESHGTHVAGTMAGDGSNSFNQGGTANQWRGIATAAQIYSYSNNTNNNGDDWFASHQHGIQTNQVVLSQNSWGGNFNSTNCNTHNLYSLEAQQMDQVVTGEAYGTGIVSSVAASNFREGQSDDQNDPFPICGFNGAPDYINYTSLSDLGSAKNILSVGATQKNATDQMADFSSWGPTRDGRLKPDIVAPGLNIFSAQPGGTYGDSSGTSMATPHISGIAALVIQRYRTVFNTQTLLPSTVKAILLHTAKDLNSDHVYYTTGPDYASGYGIADAQAAYNIIATDRVLEDSVTNGATDAFTMTVTAGLGELKATLAWDDPAPVINAGTKLINNLDLELVAPDGVTTHLPWVLDPNNPANPATKGVDSLNNVEQVLVQSPTAGVWTVRIKGTNVPNGNQRYSLVTSAATSTNTGNNSQIYLPIVVK